MSDYTFFRASPTKTVSLREEHSSHDNARQSILDKLMKEQGAVAYYLTSNGPKEILSGLVFPTDHPVLKEPHIRVLHHEHYDGQRVAVVVGKRNTKDGKRFNRTLTETQKQLDQHPLLSEWIIEQHDLYADAFLNEGGRMGIAHTLVGLASTDDGDCFIGRIPMSERKSVSLPDWAEEITHGQFIDMIEKSEKINKEKFE